MAISELASKVRQVLTVLDSQFEQDNQPTFSALVASLETAARAGNALGEADAALQIGTRLLGVATVAAAQSAERREMFGFPSEVDALEPATDYFERALDRARVGRGAQLEKFILAQLADCYMRANELVNASRILEEAIAMCVMPDDALIFFDATQKAGDCSLQLGNAASALAWYERAMETAERIRDPFEVHVQHGKIASALRNLHRYDEAMAHASRAGEQLVALQNDAALRERVLVHKNIFNAAALPSLIAYNDRLFDDIHDAVGRDLMRELPAQLARSAAVAFSGGTPSNPSAWPVFRELEIAVRTAAMILADLLETPRDVLLAGIDADDPTATLELVGSFARRHFGRDISNPPSLPIAARMLAQIDRSRRTAIYVQRAEASDVGPGPFGGGTSRHVVYLRSFVSSTRLPRVRLEEWGDVDLEELLASMLDASPVIALGDPDLERFGPGRANTSDENWRRVLRALAFEAQILLVVPAPTAGTSWEIEWIVTNKFLHKTCFIMPPPASGEEPWWREQWAQLRDWSVRLGVALPEYSPQGCVFRLTSEGGCDRIGFGELLAAGPDGLHMLLLTRLLMLPNLSYDFLYGMQRSFEADGAVTDATRAADAPTSAALGALRKLEATPRFELSNWDFDSATVPLAAGVLLLYETPFRVLWAEDVADLRDSLDSYTQGKPSAFTIRLFHTTLLPLLNARAAAQLIERQLTVEKVVGFRVKQFVSYRFQVIEDPAERAAVVSLVWSGALKHGAPTLPPGAAATHADPNNR